ncbi:MAG: L-threonylcarbamoyladenylate synthase [Legionellaceae bacterium]|nr:L-threonylcarbamoyladenylate synthase [Legionellaceae bacterium]
MSKHIVDINKARALLQAGEVIAYPTEAVYGLGCDPFNQQAVEALLDLKQRSVSKGLIILVSNWEQVWPLVGDVPEARLEAVKQTWPGPVTWIFPKSDTVPAWLSGEHDSLAIRMTAHPIARALCLHAPLVSTSANLTGSHPAKNIADFEHMLLDGVAGVVAGDLGGNTAPSEIYHVLDGARVR